MPGTLHYYMYYAIILYLGEMSDCQVEEEQLVGGGEEEEEISQLEYIPLGCVNLS